MNIVGTASNVITYIAGGNVALSVLMTAASTILAVGMNGVVKDEILVSLDVPILFVQGSKDGLCPLDKLKSVQTKLKPLNDLYVVEGGDHSLKVGKKHLLAQESTQEDEERSAVEAIAEFMAKALSED